METVFKMESEDTRRDVSFHKCISTHFKFTKLNEATEKVDGRQCQGTIKEISAYDTDTVERCFDTFLHFSIKKLCFSLYRNCVQQFPVV